MDDIKSLVRARAEAIVQIRRDLHRIPETAYQEEKTSRYVAERLDRLGLSVRTGIAKYGVVGIQTMETGGRTLMLRSELDALPIQEMTGLPFASTHPGAMHACGHDGHMAMVIGAAMVLGDLGHRMAGHIKYVFQPAEEGPGGAKPMIAANVMRAPDVDYTLGCHLWPGIPLGTVGVRPGPIMAAMDRFDLTIRGRAGHAAMPHLCIDALDVGVQVVNALQRIVSRHMNPMQPTVVTVGQFHAGTASNIIAGEVQMSGTTRTFDPEIWKSWPSRIDAIVGGICNAMGAGYALDYQTGYPVTVNDAWMTAQVKRYAAHTVGAENVVTPEKTMGGEDISFFLEQSQGCFFCLGSGGADRAALHNPHFDFDEAVLLTGVEIYCRAALDLLSKAGSRDRGRDSHPLSA